MIEPKDLRLKNLVYSINRRGRVHMPDTIPLKVLELREFNCSVLHYEINPAQVNNGSYSVAPYSDLEGIPLTEEWLLKFGFEKNYRYFTTGSVGGDMSFCISSSGSGFYWCNWETQWGDSDWQSKVEVVYVHQLQNLYHALTGTDLPLDLINQKMKG